VRSWKSFGCSDALAANLTTFNEVNHMRRCFVGEFSDWIDYPEGWIGDEINIESSNGSVKLLYDAEPKAKDLKAASRPKYQAPSPRSGVLRRHRKE
jgi:hypothetical protein